MAGTSPRAHTGVRPPPGTAEDGDPRNHLKVTLGHRWSGIIRDIKSGEYTWQQFCEGLDEEELARGQLKAEDGTFKGRPPMLVPREFHLACQRELKRRFEELFSSEVIELTKEYLRMCKSENIPEKDRAKLLQYAMERVFGGIPKTITVTQEQPWEEMIVNVVRDPEGGGMPAHLRERYERYAERQGDGASKSEE